MSSTDTNLRRKLRRAISGTGTNKDFWRSREITVGCIAMVFTLEEGGAVTWHGIA